MNGLCVPAASSMDEASSRSEWPATSARAKPAFNANRRSPAPGNPRVLARTSSGKSGAEPIAPAIRARTSCEST